MSKRSILVVDDDVTVQTLIGSILTAEGYDVALAPSAEDGLKLAQEREFSLALLDIVIPEMGGEALLAQLTQRKPTLPVVILTGNRDTDLAVRCIRNGARDFLTKPCEKNRLLTTIQNTVRLRELEAELTRSASAEDSFGALVGRSAPMRQLFEQLRIASSSDISVLLEGPSGTGKELAARALHTTGARSGGPFVALNCGAIPETLLESELFGHEKGAFTGAQSTHRGAFEQAQNGTLFLDEIGEMRPDMQVRLLRALENHEVRRIGGTAAIKLDVRIVAATNKRLQEEVRSGGFREDLYYRLAVFRVPMPTLAARGDDIPWLAHKFLLEFSSKYHKRCNRFDPQAEQALLKYPWPGNVRQLRNAIERAALVCATETIQPGDLPEEIRAPGSRATATAVSEAVVSPPAGSAATGPTSEPAAVLSMEEEEERIFRNALRVAHGDVAHAATLLKISRATLYRRIKELGIDKDSSA